MREFEDNPICPACRSSYPKSYHRYGYKAETGTVGTSEIIPEHLQIECQRCDYKWKMEIAKATPGESSGQG